MNGTRGQGGLYVWAMLLVVFAGFSFLYVILNNQIENTLPAAVSALNQSLTASTMTDTVLPIWRALPWAFLFGLGIYVFYTQRQ